jgi:hypothetical protein
MALKAISRIEIPAAWRFRCHGRGDRRAGGCGAAARWRATDADRADALTFFCDGCRPDGAELITPADPFLSIGLGVVVVIGGSTAMTADAVRQARADVERALSSIGARCEVVGNEAGLLLPRRLAVGDGPPARPGGPRKADS